MIRHGEAMRCAASHAANDGRGPHIGMSGRFPQADDIHELWKNLKAGRDCISEVPQQRWDWHRTQDLRSPNGRKISRWGGFINSPDCFVAPFFRMSPREAEITDPQERLFLEVCWEAIEDAGYTPKSLASPRGRNKRQPVGVFVGVMHKDYSLIGAEELFNGSSVLVSLNCAPIANRVSYFCNFHGPSMAVDTVCSSSLTAVHLAIESIRNGECEVALAGGVNLSLHPAKYITYGLMEMHSSDGRCRTFAKGGDGYVSGEGIGAVLLKPLEKALEDQDHIYAVIRGSSINHVGTVSGITVPSPVAQADMIVDCLEKAKVHPRTISYVETHGTGTSLGDPIELEGLTKAFHQFTQDRQFCAVGSIKSNIGHGESSAGIGGLIKIALQLEHRMLVPSLHAGEPNPYIDWENSPFVVQREMQAWEPAHTREEGKEIVHPRRAALSSFGATGSNAHLIVEESPTGDGGDLSIGNSRPMIIPLSARNEDRLHAYVEKLLAFVTGQNVDLDRLAYSLQLGREAFDVRVAFVVNDMPALVDRLKAYVDGKNEIEGCYRGTKKQGKEAIALLTADEDSYELIKKWIAKGKKKKIAELWVKGLTVEWHKLYGGGIPGRISAPTYPFAKERYWLSPRSKSGSVAKRDGAPATLAFLHPLLHQNTSDLKEQRYSTRLTGEEFFLAGHEVAVNGSGKRKVMPAAAYLEMARAAIEQASGEREEGAVLELRDVVWAEPLVVEEEGREVNIALQAEETGEIGFEIYSVEGGEEIVHCQGHGEWSARVDVAKLEVKQLQQEMLKGEGGTRQIVAELELREGMERSATEYVLHPGMVDRALGAAKEVVKGGGEASSWKVEGVEKVRILSRCGEKMLVWIRESQGKRRGDGAVKVDVDLSDEQGKVCVQMEAVSWVIGDERAGAVERPAVAVYEEDKAGVQAVERGRREIVLRPGGEKSGEEKAGGVEASKASKPRGILLAEIESGGVEKAGVVKEEKGGRGGIRLRKPGEGDADRGEIGETGESVVRLFDCGEGVYRIEMGERGKERREVRAVGEVGEAIEELLVALERVEEEKQLKVVMIVGMEEWLGARREEYNAAMEQLAQRYRDLKVFNPEVALAGPEFSSPPPYVAEHLPVQVLHEFFA